MLEDDSDDFADMASLAAQYDADPVMAPLMHEARKSFVQTYLPGELSIRSLRLAQGLSQEALAQAIGSNQGHVSKIELGRIDPNQIHASTVKSLAKVLGRTADEILDLLHVGEDA
ncbi:helix-turn-helix transcriptional regulator [Lysobacter korlensis]|uniref:Helix-turn-helix transcriptional regulator n=1 Tax=Lysobacter korlensis TaxID=553636 RepID=A0ABV6RKH5_9GAMM